MTRIILIEMEGRDIPFLLEFWRDPEVMTYADEFSLMRGWGKSEDPVIAWGNHQERRSESTGKPGSPTSLAIPRGRAKGSWNCGGGRMRKPGF
jgi:hypothetical protein